MRLTVSNQIEISGSSQSFKGALLKLIWCALIIATFFISTPAIDKKPGLRKKISEPKATACHQSVDGKSQLSASPFQNRSIPDVPVVDQFGKSRHFYRDLVRGKTVVINFIYTTCEAVCPIQGKAFAKIQQALSHQSATQLELISITLDPQRDSPARLKSWGNQFGAKPGWTFVTGDKSAIDQLLEVLTGDPSGKREHASVMLIGNARNNRWSRTYSFAPPERVLEIVESLNDPQVTRP